MLKRKFGEQVEIVLHNIFFDNPAETEGLVERVTWERLKLPVIFIDDEPALTGQIDEAAVSEMLKARGLEPVHDGAAS